VPYADPVKAKASAKTRSAIRYAAAKEEGGESWLRVLQNRKQQTARRRALVKADRKYWLYRLLVQTRGRCARGGILFSLAQDDVELPDTCPITKRALLYVSDRRDNDGPSLDRIIPALGYVRGNVRILSRRANRIRQDCLDPDIFRALADDAERIRGRV
jgi:hypothetical protein